MLPKIHLSIERWKKNKEYGAWVSNQGNVRLLKNKQLLIPRISENGYCTVFTDQGAILVHRLVAFTWLGKQPGDNYDVDHINSNKRDNSVKNLRWVSREVNLAYAAFMRCKTPTEKTHQCEGVEDELSVLMDSSLLDEQRLEELKRLFKEQKITVSYDKKTVSTFSDLINVKNTLANSQHDMTHFVKRVLMVANNPIKYCGKIWKIQVV